MIYMRKCYIIIATWGMLLFRRVSLSALVVTPRRASVMILVLGQRREVAVFLHTPASGRRE